MIYSGFAIGVQNIWSKDRSTQEHYLGIVGTELRGLSVEFLRALGCFFVPNNDYLLSYFGRDCLGYEYEIYDFNGNCLLNNCLVIPCYSLMGNVIAWVAYNPLVRVQAFETKDFSRNYYSYPSKIVWDKSKYLFTTPEVYKKALEDGYIILTDGVFDTLSLISYGLHAGSLLGSYINIHNLFYLKFIPKIFVSIDNDQAGLNMYRNIRKFIPHAKSITQGISKDIDDILKTEDRDLFLTKLRVGIENYVSVKF